MTLGLARSLNGDRGHPIKRAPVGEGSYRKIHFKINRVEAVYAVAIEKRRYILQVTYKNATINAYIHKYITNCTNI